MKTDRELLGQIGRCVKSAADTYERRTPYPSCYNALGDIESDLEGALKAIKELFRRRNAMDDLSRPYVREALDFINRR